MRGMPDPEPKRPWFRLQGRSRRHTYYRAVSDVPGILLFALITLLGLAALGAAGWHWHASHRFVHADRVMAGIGVFLVVLGAWEGVKLARR